jgi:hypothetical protein
VPDPEYLSYHEWDQLSRSLRNADLDFRTRLRRVFSTVRPFLVDPPLSDLAKAAIDAAMADEHSDVCSYRHEALHAAVLAEHTYGPSPDDPPTVHAAYVVSMALRVES